MQELLRGLDTKIDRTFGKTPKIYKRTSFVNEKGRSVEFLEEVDNKGNLTGTSRHLISVPIYTEKTGLIEMPLALQGMTLDAVFNVYKEIDDYLEKAIQDQITKQKILTPDKFSANFDPKKMVIPTLK